MWISGGKPTQYADHAVEGEQDTSAGGGVGGARAEDGDARKNRQEREQV